MSVRIAAILKQHQGELLNEWMREQGRVTSRRSDLISDADLRQECASFLQLLVEASSATGFQDVRASVWNPVRDLLAEVSRSRSRKGFSPGETATFVFSLKQPFFTRLRAELGAEDFSQALWEVTQVLDALGLHTTEVHQRTREEVITRQQEEMMELSTPVVELWQGVLALPLIGTLDSGRTQTVMENLLQRLVETEAEIAIIDITGVPTVDTLTAQHLLKTVTATRLMGADCIISGIRPQIAQTIVQLGVDLGNVLTRSTMAGALSLALKRRGLSVVSTGSAVAQKGGNGSSPTSSSTPPVASGL